MKKLSRFLYTFIYNIITFFWVVDTFLLGIATLAILITLLFYGIGASFTGMNVMIVMCFYAYWFLGLCFIIVIDPPDRKFPPK